MHLCRTPLVELEVNSRLFVEEAEHVRTHHLNL
jgi:hypothetical protein